ncbi:phospholipid N-methyltransferase [Xanthomonas arboricola]|uniref:class I SAM-dependent methyltransferase n=1 Tax=Xanthomonas arboricola TaxID=56448 RepID=UPI00141A927D|nr:methyltransferase domain-containing protein [Xanthomonas arboricola]NIJ84921.1 phospholipid N-methyltransferase [Xanthomonas arboricola]
MFQSHNISFFREWILAPFSVAAVLPSGRALASIITAGLSGLSGRVLEIGPGTGVFTQAILERGVKEEDVLLLELNKRFSSILHQRFPKASLLHMNAFDLESLPVLGGGVDVIICGLGLMNISPDKVKILVRGAFMHLNHDGRMYLFTYGFKCSVPEKILEELDLQAIRTGRTYRNFPPATIYCLTRRSNFRQGNFYE